MLEKLFLLDSAREAPQTAALHASHSPGLVTLSLLVAFVSTYAAFSMAQVNRQATSSSHRWVSRLCASMVLGLGIWAMHFIGMLAMSLPIPVQYDIALTAFSILPGIVAAFFALNFWQAPQPKTQHMVSSGALLGIGIAAMHYSGVAAMQSDAALHMSWPLFAVSLVLGWVLATASFAAQGRAVQKLGSHAAAAWRQHLLPAVLMTAAIASMHYVAMHAMDLHLPVEAALSAHVPLGSYRNTQLSLLIASMAALFFMVFGLATALLRYRDLWQAVATRDVRLNAMIETAPDGVITIDAQGLIQDFNAQAQRVFGYRREEVIGRNISCLMPSPLAEQHDAHLRKHLDQPNQPLDVRGREVLGKHKDGRLIPLQLTIGKATTTSGTIFVGYLQDISERKRTDAQLRIAASVFQHVREGVAIVDANHNLSDANPAFLRMMETTRESCLGQPLESLYEQAETPPDMTALWQEVAAQHYWQSESKITRGNGSTWMQRLSISPVLNEQQRPHHFIAVISDLSPRQGQEGTHAELYDSATSLPGSYLFMSRLTESLQEARKKGAHAGVLLVQFSMLKKAAMQPELGNAAGAISLIAQLLQQQLRTSDTIGLYAERQLAVILPGLKDQTSFQALVKRLIRKIEQTDAIYAHYGVTGMKAGSASTHQLAFTASELLEIANADMAMLAVPVSIQPPTPAPQIKHN